MALSSEISNEYIRPFVQSDYDKWKSNIVSKESSTTQVLDKTTHSNYNTPYSYTYHSDNGKHSDYTAHSDRDSYHTDSHYNNASDYYWHENGRGHNNVGTNHTNDSNAYTYTTTDSNGKPVVKPGHANYSTGGGMQENYIHANRDHPMHKNTGHSNSTPHANRNAYHSDSHSNYSNHSNGSTHTNDGFTHSNYIPSTPYVYELESTVKRIYGTTTIRMFAYDANEYGSGSQLSYSKNVLYKVEIRQTKTLSGTAKTSSWVTLKDYDINSTYSLNTVDPLRTGNSVASNTEGYYEIRVTPKNEAHSENGVSRTYVGVPKTVTVRIEQNNIPKITVKNANEFINFTFGYDAAKSASNVITQYGNNMFKDAPKDKVQGIFLSISVTDKDANNYVKGKAYIVDSTGAKVSLDNSIIWSNGLEYIKTNSTAKEGIVFINKTQYLKNKELTNCKIEIVLTDYLNEDCSVVSGQTIIQRNVSDTDSRNMILNIDNVAPSIAITPDSTVWKPKVTLSVNATDSSGIRSIKLPDYNMVYTNKCTYEVLRNGGYLFEVTDALGNVSSKSIYISNVDNRIPIASFTPSASGPWTNKPVKVSWSLTDLDSGVKQWRRRIVTEDKFGNKVVTPWSNLYTTTTTGFYDVVNQGKVTIEIEAEDIAGNSGIITSPVILLDTEKPKATMNLDDFIPNKYTYVPLKLTDVDDNLSGIKTIRASLHSDFTDAVVLNDVTENTVDIDIPRKDVVKESTVYIEVTDLAGNVFTDSRATYLEPYPPNKPEINSPNDNILIVKDEPILFDFIYSDPGKFPLIKTEILFENRDTKEKYTYTNEGNLTTFRVTPLVSKGYYNVSITVWNSENKFTTGDRFTVRKEKYKLDGNVYSNEITAKGSVLTFLQVQLDKDLETKLNALGQRISSVVGIDVILPNALGVFENSISANNKITLTKAQIEGKDYIKLPKNITKLKVNITMKSPDVDITPILDGIKVLAK